jgi:hypothetical protein
MSIPTDLKISDMTQEDLDALIKAYNRLDAAFAKGHSMCTRIMMDGMGVDSTDVRFHNCVVAHQILQAFTPAVETLKDTDRKVLD